jgi:hypothetical protein
MTDLPRMKEGSLEAFVRESNRIEGILREPTETELRATRTTLTLHRIGVGHLEAFVAQVADAALRDQPGMDVRVGAHVPPPGGPHIRSELTALLTAVEAFDISEFEAHIAYETLHPFMDGNGRSGRVLWAWHMQNAGLDPFALPFLHRFYYQTLDASGRE